MRRKLLIILAAIIAFGPALSVLYYASTRLARPAARYPDFHAVWAVVSIICGYVGLVTALDLVLQVLRPGRRLSHSVLLCTGTSAGCVAGLLSLWMLWLTPWRLWLLIVSGLALTGLFYLLYRCRCRFELGLFGAVFAAAGLALFASSLREVYIIADMATWLKTEGKITDSGASGLHASRFMTRILAYEYVVDGQRYKGSEDSWRSSRMQYGWDTNLHRLSSYAWNEKVAVYYDPSRPDRAVLMPGLSYATAFVLRTSLLSLFGGMMLLVASAQIRQAKEPMSRMVGTAGPAEASHRFRPWPGRIAFAVLSTCALLAVLCIQPLYPGAMKVARIDKVPGTADELCERGLDFLREHDPQRAFNNFTRALRFNPNDAALYYNRGHACAQMGQMAQAVENWKQAIQMDWHMVFHVYYDQRSLVPDDVALDEIITGVALDHLPDLGAVSGYAVGYGGTAGEFYTASLILSAHLDDGAFLGMAANGNPIVRAMALICLARRDIAHHRTTILSFYNDAAKVMYVPMGCGASPISLGALARNIIEDPNTLRYWDPEKTKWRWQRKQSE
jgi:tetratricopeptide (TPR) repeat protein